MNASRRRVRALGTLVDALTLSEAVDEVVTWLSDAFAGCRYVVTPNLDHAVLLSERPDFRAAYDDAALVLPDGAPLLWAARLNGDPLPERVAGSDLGPAVLERAPQGTRFFLLGGSEQASIRALEVIERTWPHVSVVGRLCPPLGFEKSPEWSAQIISSISASKAQVIIVGLGAPKQELWVHAHRGQLQGTIALCLGATIDFIGGTKVRAPVWMQNVGLEWLHRAGSEPRRLAARYARDAARLPGLLLRDRTGQWPRE